MENKIKLSKVKHYTNVVLHKLAQHFPSQHPDSLLPSIISNHFVNNGRGDIICKFIEEVNTILYQVKPPITEYNAQGKKALVFLLKGHFYIHNIHNYILAHVLKTMGYDVHLITCQGNLERCGNSQQNFEFRSPPFSCNVCKKIVDSFDTQGFKTISLNQFSSENENDWVNQLVIENKVVPAFAYSKKELLDLSSPYLLRFFNGDLKKITVDNEETQLHLKSAARLMLRYRKLLDQINPSVIVFFNGTFYPEHMFIAEAEKRNISFYCTERGMKKNSLFVSRNMPATNYDAGKLWDIVKETIGSDNMEAANLYLTNRMKGPEDPTGIKRNVSIGSIEKYQQLSRVPYTVFFAPVTHDTASMGKNNCIGNVFDNIFCLAKNAIRHKKRLVIRCHPDEKSESNPSHYTIKEFLAEKDLLSNEYVICLPTEEIWHPYTLAEYANAIVVYNGTLGVELPALGYTVFNLGMSHYTNKGFTVDIDAERDLDKIFTFNKQKITKDIQQLALRYLYYYTNIANLNVDHLLHEERPFIFATAKSFEQEERKEQIKDIYKRVLFYETLT